MDEAALTVALREWQTVLEPSHPECAPSALESAATATFATRGRVRAILRPGSRAELQVCLQVANRHKIPIYPLSTGKNWGYGSRAPIDDGVLLDLSRLNRIVDFDEDLAFVTVEPGVTQRQLFEFLRERKSRLWMDATGASPDCSIIGNTMERGFGHTPMGDHWGNSCGLEVVLPTGEVIETGFARFPGSKTGSLSRWGVGPSLDGLFAQSNLGIVTRMTVWLMPAPEHFEAFFFAVADDSSLGAVIDALRPLRMNGTLSSVMHIGNDYKVLAGMTQYPWDEMAGKTPLGREQIRIRRERLGVGCWNGSGGLYGTRGQVRQAKRLLRRGLTGKVQRLQFVNDRLLRLMDRLASPLGMVMRRDVRNVLKVLAPVYGLLKGVPTDEPLASAYWRKKTGVPREMDPDRDGCGLLWCSPVVPNTGAHVIEVARLAGDLLLDHGFEPQMSISLASARTSVVVITISYDRSVAGDDDRAERCYRTLATELIARGYPPYRLPINAMDLAAGHSGHDRVVQLLKDAIDPYGIVAPGRYQSPVGHTALAR